MLYKIIGLRNSIFSGEKAEKDLEKHLSLQISAGLELMIDQTMCHFDMLQHDFLSGEPQTW